MRADGGRGGTGRSGRCNGHHASVPDATWDTAERVEHGQPRERGAAGHSADCGAFSRCAGGGDRPKRQRAAAPRRRAEAAAPEPLRRRPPSRRPPPPSRLRPRSRAAEPVAPEPAAPAERRGRACGRRAGCARRADTRAAPAPPRAPPRALARRAALRRACAPPGRRRARGGTCPPGSDPSEWGRVDDDGTVYVRTADGERAVGSWQAGEPAAGLAHYGRRFDDLATEVALLEARLHAHTGNPAELKSKAQALADSIPTATAVGDLDGLAERARSMVGDGGHRGRGVARRAGGRARGPDRPQGGAGRRGRADRRRVDVLEVGRERLKAIVEEWKAIRGIDRKTDEALWTRFAAARDAFGRRRGTHFASLDAQRGEARAAKQELIKEAQRLSTSTEWGPTSAAMRGLMDRWKEVPRTGRDGDDDLWKQFRAAQDVFFEARSQSDKQRTDEELANQKLKEEILAEAEKLDVSGDLRGAQNTLRKLQERYDAVGHVPRGVMRSLEDRMQAVEQKVRGAADTSRARTAPENPMVTSMRAAVTKAEEQLAKAEAAGDKGRIEEAKANLATRQEWLAEAEKAAARRCR